MYYLYFIHFLSPKLSFWQYAYVSLSITDFLNSSSWGEGYSIMEHPIRVLYTDYYYFLSRLFTVSEIGEGVRWRRLPGFESGAQYSAGGMAALSPAETETIMISPGAEENAVRRNEFRKQIFPLWLFACTRRAGRERERERVICLFYAVIYRCRLRQRKKQKTREGFAGRARRAPPGSATRSPAGARALWARAGVRR